MTASERREQILSRLTSVGYLNANQLSEEFDVDSSTIRRDLIHLEKRGLIIRTHGGVLPVLSSDGQDTPYNIRKARHHDEKVAIGIYAASLVKDGDSVILDNGSTVYELAVILTQKKNLTVITNDLKIAMLMSQFPGINLNVTGGAVAGNSFTLVGPDATRKFAEVYADWAFMGAEGVDPEAGITNVNAIEIPTKKAILSAARKKVILVDSSKIGYRALSHVCPLAEVDIIITGKKKNEKVASFYSGKLHFAH
ncbi:DeoR/GlpR transcriptional regulator [Salmonella enterica]|uniref:DeoR/GlpR family DNA-binding transcription regulator n=1 Tax=Salmonella enterica TaxID=28901 RepID=UPI0012BE03AC|nr:DeoR/GlpR family DNA-binding transcription regulator [Salmonella enterica]EBS7633954.1 DeoR/GlpR transcriptional regulator [Salmonella enterica]MDR7937699.1 DeoR/GlpR family DNA-binding transcription regulator [Salmonella enterica subsp. enterica serovar Gatineau]